MTDVQELYRKIIQRAEDGRWNIDKRKGVLLSWEDCFQMTLDDAVFTCATNPDGEWQPKTTPRPPSE